MILRYLAVELALDGERSFDDGGGETGGDVPFDVAVKEPDAGVVGAEAQDEVPVWADEDSVAAHWGGVCQGWGWGGGVVGSGFCVAALEDLEGVAVEVERVSVWSC